MRIGTIRLRVLCAALSMVLALCACAAYPARAERTPLSFDAYHDMVSTYSIDESVLGYNEYLLSVPSARPALTLEIPASAYARYEEDGRASSPLTLEGADGAPNAAVLTSEDSLIEYVINVPESGLYDLSILYYPHAGKNTEIQRACFIDGKLPYEELALLHFYRVWQNGQAPVVLDGDGVSVRAWQKDNQGNDLKPSPSEAPEWILRGMFDSNGYISEQLSVYLEAGAHTLTLLALREPMLIDKIVLSNVPRPLSYAHTKAAWDAQIARAGGEAKGVSVRIEAENAIKTSSQMLYPKQDQASPSVYPASAKYLLNNVIGGYSWRMAGQWIEWEFAVPADGYYQITLNAKQNFVRGIDVSRKIYIDGEVPFAEMDSMPFSYSQNWRMETISDAQGEPYMFYLSAGAHTLRMEVVLGDMSQIIGQMQKCVLKLNSIYRKVLYITGVAPDKYRDYQIEASLPGLEAELIDVKADLGVAIRALEKTAGSNSDKLTVLRTMDDQLDELIKDQERFTEVISSYKTNVRACGNWITQVLGQPLAIDRIYIHTPDIEPSSSRGDWFSRAFNEIKRLYYSFVIDYNQVGNVRVASDDDVVLTLWISTGRDQANAIKSLIDERFTNQTGIGVNVQLVDMNSLLRATLSGEGPDVAIQVANTNYIAGAVLDTGNDTPVNYGLRHAVMDLTRFEDFGEVAARFSPSALTPFSFNGATYALPDTMTFPMMFYRKDILAEIELELPQTWDDVKVAMSALSKNQMEFGMLPSEQIFAMLLFQNGGEYYTPNGDASRLDTDVAVNTFKKYCEYYTDYKLDKATSVEERFRTGECPIIISDYTTYNNLQVSAPDLNGLWDFTLVPGTLMPDGTINRTTGLTGLADIIMSNTKHPDECWEFLKWWTSEETQTLYGREMESLMGASARVPTANLAAIANLSWSLRAYKALSEQLSYTRGIPQVPGGYFSWRNLNNAFFTITEDQSNQARDGSGTTPREELMEKVYYINAEINYKRAEFGLPLAGGAEGE